MSKINRIGMFLIGVALGSIWAYLSIDFVDYDGLPLGINWNIWLGSITFLLVYIPMVKAVFKEK